MSGDVLVVVGTFPTNDRDTHALYQRNTEGKPTNGEGDGAVSDHRRISKYFRPYITYSRINNLKHAKRVAIQIYLRLLKIRYRIHLEDNCFSN